MTQTDTNTPTQRHWLYGFNFVILVIAAVVILGFLLYLTNVHSAHFDWSGGLYSLSPSTKALLKDISAKHENYTLISVFPDIPVEGQENKQQRVADLMGEYTRASANIKAEDGHAFSQDEIMRRLRPLFAGEIKTYEDALAEFDTVFDGMNTFCKEEAQNINALAQKPGNSPQSTQDAAELQGLFANRIPKIISETKSELNKGMDSTAPSWTSLVASLKADLTPIQQTLMLLSDPKMVAQSTPGMATYLTANSARYKAVALVTDYLDKLNKLPPMKIQEVLGTFGANTILVLGPTSARVVNADDIYPDVRESAQDKTVDFKGEQAVSSALMSMVRPDKVKVVFISPSPQKLLTSQFTAAAKLLRTSNFEPLEWSPPGPPMGPDQPPDAPTPPAEGKGVVWVVFQPDVPNPMTGRGGANPQPIIDAVNRHLAAGGRVLFLAEAANMMSAMQGGGTFPYDSITKAFGIDVQCKYTVVNQREDQDPDTGEVSKKTEPSVYITRFPENEITRGLQSLLTVFFPMAAQSPFGGPPILVGAPTIVTRSTAIPANVESKVFVESPKQDYWALTEYQPEAVYNKATDFAPPCPLAVAAVRNKGKDLEQRVIVIGSRFFAADSSQRYRPVLIGGTLRRESMIPGNLELFRNSIIWLSGYENMIAVSSQADVAARIGDVSPRAMDIIRWAILFTGAPLSALLVGGIIWFVRRR